ncbi:MAG: hypothetical protein LIO77_09280, partial [Rikenellaceae bacterium]|nr:hypothetical protein [Rikenellaceae bacterium]
MAEYDYTKETIKARMLSVASSLWSVRNPDSLDPVVRLLIESLASEIFKLAGELEQVESRIVDKLARTFIPSYMMSATPAHAILHARALSGITEITPQTEFAYKAPSFIQKYNLSKLVFTPVRDTKIINGDVAALISGGRFFSVTAHNGKEHIANTYQRSPMLANTLWIGLDIESGMELPDCLPFFFQLPFSDNTSGYYNLLKYVNLNHNGIPLPVSAGLPESKAVGDETPFGVFDPRRQLYKDITEKYDFQFLTADCRNIQGDNLKKERLPQSISHLFTEEFTGSLKRELIWIEALLPPALQGAIIDQLSVAVNCFPAANIYQTTTNGHISSICSIIPLSKDEQEYFIGVDKVVDSHNRELKEVRNHNETEISGTYTLRRGGSERFNSLNAKEYIERLVDIYRDETTAFSGFGRDIAATLDTLLSDLKELELKLGSYDKNTEQASYLIFSADTAEKKYITARYSLTNAAVANGIQSRESLSVPEISDLEPSSALFITSSRGGRRTPTQSSQRGMYQYLLTSRDRIYTKEDIKQFCTCYYGDYFGGIAIENGYEISSAPGQGVIRTTRIILKDVKIKDDEIDPEV